VVLGFGQGEIKCVKSVFLLQFIFKCYRSSIRWFQEFGRYTKFSTKVMPVFLFRD
jgi:hypothetical protein